jgi:flagellar basal-body rod protein FlgG
MIRALNTAATGMKAQEENVNVIANNISNVNTTGFKKERAEFSDLLYQTVEAPGSMNSESAMRNVGVQVGSGTKLTGIRKDFTVGNPQITNNPLDLMISGDGFFGIQKDNGQIAYTRDGSFGVDATGTIVTKSGDKLFPGVQFPPNTTTISIAANGQVSAFVQGQVEPIQVTSIPVFRFINPTGLSSMGGNLFQETPASGPAAQMVAGAENVGPISQGMIETSNVSVMNEMTNMIKAQRAYEMNSKVMNVADRMLETVNNIR